MILVLLSACLKIFSGLLWVGLFHILLPNDHIQKVSFDPSQLRYLKKIVTIDISNIFYCQTSKNAEKGQRIFFLKSALKNIQIPKFFFVNLFD